MSSWSAGRESQAYPCPFPASFSFTKLAVRKEAGAAIPGSLLSHREPCCVPLPKVMEVPSEQQDLKLGVLFCREKVSISDVWRRFSVPSGCPCEGEYSTFVVFHCSVSAGFELTCDAR